MKGNELVLKDLPKKNKWCDKDQVMLCACFQLLVDFLENEKPQKTIPGPLAQTTSHIVLSEDKKAWTQLRNAEDQFEKLEDEMLKRLIAVRKHLWC